VATIVIPFAGVDGKTRLHASPGTRRELSLAMLGDVLAACIPFGRTLVVTSSGQAGVLAAELGADIVSDPGGGQGSAVQAALAGLKAGAILVVNADLPCSTPDDLEALAAATPDGGMGLVEAGDGTTNALSLPSSHAFAPLYGAGSAARFRDHAHTIDMAAVTVHVPNLIDDVDTLYDLQHLQPRCGPRTQACLALLPEGAAA
jgi:2-phospho-L-lactate guanylyltransferase